MALEFQTVDVRFDKGLDTRTQPKLVVPGKWSQLQNCTLSEDGTPQRRDGLVALLGSLTGNGLATYNRELLTVDGKTVSSITTARTDAAVPIRGSLGYVTVAKEEVYRSTALIDSLDTATGNGFTCHVWRESTNPVIPNGIKYTLVDETTGTKVFSEVQLAASLGVMSPRVVFSVDAFFIFWIDDTPAMQCVVVRVSGTPTQGSLVAIVSNAAMGQKNFDAVSADTFALGVPMAMVSYPWNDASTSVRTIGVTHTAGVPSISLGPTNLMTQANVTYGDITAVCCALYSTTRAGTYVMTTGATGGTLGAGVFGRVTDQTWTTVGAILYIDGAVTTYAGSSHITAMADINGVMHLYYDQRARQGTVGFLPVRTVTVSAVPAVTVAAATLLSSASFDQNAARASGPMGPWIAGKAFRVGLFFYLPMYIQEDWGSTSLGALGANCANLNSQCTFLLMDGITGVVVARALYGTLSPDGQIATGGTIPTAAATPCSVATLSSGVFSISLPERTRLSFANGKNVSQAGAVRLTLTPNFSSSPIHVQIGESTHFAGGSLSSYDGSGLTEQGFPLFPEGISVVRNAGAGGLTSGVHQVVAIYEWVDGSGNLVQSGPSLPVSFTSLGSDTADVIVPTLLVSQKTGIRIVLFMTQAAGTTFNRVTPVYAPLLNLTSATIVTATLTASDASIASNELLYTGLALANYAPGPCAALAVHQNRLVFDRADQPGTWGFSQRYVENVGLRFNEELSGTVDVQGGRLVAFASMDEKLIIFSDKKPFVVYGAGPDALGTGSYGEPQEVPSDVGCSEARSVLKMPHGIIFKSLKGWYILGRDLQVRYIGDAVAAFDANDVTSATLLADRQECRFASSSGTQLIYSYDLNEWSTTVYRAEDHAGVPQTVTVSDALYWGTGGYYVTLSTFYGLNRDTPGVFLDQPGSALVALPIITTARTAWLKMAIINGFQRVRKLFLTGTSPTAPTSTLVVSVDFDDAYGQVALGSYQFTVAYGTMFPTFTVGNPVDFRHSLQHQKCKSVAFTFVDTPTVANPAGVNFQALSLELGLKRGLKRLPAAQST